MSIIKKGLIQLSGNRFMQGLLEKNVTFSKYLMGIGAGAAISSSGEQGIFDLLKQLKPPSPYCVFDVGANSGQFLRLTLRQLDSSDFKIHCFEPGHEAFKELSQAAQKEHRVKLNNIGLGKEKSKETLYYDRAGSGLASLTKRRLAHFDIKFESSEEISIDTIDSYCVVNLIDHIHLLKVDIEGHELDALAGAKQMFGKRSIDIVSFEFGGCNIDTRTFFQDFWYFFSEIDFKLFRITPSGYIHPLKTYREIHEQFRTVNFVAIAGR